jgi:hypothetical protein
MRHILVFILMLFMVGVAAGFELGNRMPAKGDAHVNPQEGVNPRQGGDTVFDATPIAGLPFSDAGTTASYANDYDEACPYSDSTAPDVVYSLTAAGDMSVDVDLCGSAYEGLGLVACNDDFYNGDPCGVYVSKLVGVPMIGGSQYFIVIDGYGGDYGDYILSILECAPSNLDCPPEGFPEGEPPLQDDQINAFNDGCSSANPDGFQDLSGDETGSLILCGTSGWFLYQSSNFRDSDWFVATFGPDGIIELTAAAELPLYVFELGPQDCADVGVVQQITVGPCVTASMTITGEPFATVWLWTGATTFTSPDGSTPYEFRYLLTIEGLGVVATESSTWSQVKGLYR